VQNEIRIKVLEDGMLSIETGAFSQQVHMEADQLLERLQQLVGGDVTIEEKRPGMSRLQKGLHHEGKREHRH